MHNPYKPTTVPLEESTLEAKLSKGFPFSLIVRWIVSALVVFYGGMRLIDLANGWSFLANRSIIDFASNPFFRLAGDLCILLTGILLWRRSKFVFIPLLIHVVTILWFVFGFGPTPNIPSDVFVVWTAQSGLLGFCFWLFLKQRLR